MIGKLSSAIGRKLDRSTASGAHSVEYTVEILPFLGTTDSIGVLTGGNFLTIPDATGEPVVGSLKIPGQPFDNEGGGGGGSQKTPPPSTP